MTSTPLSTLPVARYRFRFRLQDPLRLPEYAGSLLRGQFGAALRKHACITGAPRCPGCPLQGTCSYPRLFEAPAPAAHALQRFSQIPNPYVIEAPPWGCTTLAAGQTLSFSLVLIGHALDNLARIAAALRHALAQGLTRQRSRGELVAIDWECAAPGTNGESDWQSLWRPGQTALADHSARLCLPVPPPDPARLSLVFETPLRLQQQGHPVRIDALTARKLIADLLRRISLLFEFHAGQPGLVPDPRALVRHAESLEEERALHWQDWSRYSSRQRQAMTLGGALGHWHLSGELAPLWPWLWLGQWLHVGKNASMGLGRYRLLASPLPGRKLASATDGNDPA